MNGPLDESVTLQEIVAIVSARRVPLAPELAGYLALEVAEQCASDDDDVDPAQIYVSDEGSVAVVRVRKAKDADSAAEATVRGLLAKLLEASGSQTPALAACARKRASGGVAALATELEAALIPVNRSAGRRALARLAREVKRVVLGVGRNASLPTSERGGRVPTVAPPAAAPAAPIDPPAAAASVTTPASEPDLPASASASATLNVEPPPRAAAAASPSVDALIRDFKVSDEHGDKALSRELRALAGVDVTPPPPVVAAPTPQPAVRETPRDRRAADDADDSNRSLPVDGDRHATTAPSQFKRRPAAGAATEVRSRGAGAGLAVALVVVALLAATTYALKPDWFGARRPDKPAPDSRAPEAVARAAQTADSPAQCRTSLIVTDAPEGSEILLRVGQSPADIDRMPVGVRLEFVASAEGYEPKRAVVAAGGAWDKGANGRPRHELTVQLERSKAKPGQPDAWPPGEPGSVIGGSGNGAGGVVHLVSSPQGAEVWLLAGLGPRETVDDLAACDVDVDLLIAGPKLFRKRLHVLASQFQPDPAKPGGWRTARISAAAPLSP